MPLPQETLSQYERSIADLRREFNTLAESIQARQPNLQGEEKSDEIVKLQADVEKINQLFSAYDASVATEKVSIMDALEQLQQAWATYEARFKSPLEAASDPQSLDTFLKNYFLSLKSRNLAESSFNLKYAQELYQLRKDHNLEELFSEIAEWSEQLKVASPDRELYKLVTLVANLTEVLAKEKVPVSVEQLIGFIECVHATNVLLASRGTRETVLSAIKGLNNLFPLLNKAELVTVERESVPPLNSLLSRLRGRLGGPTNQAERRRLSDSAVKLREQLGLMYITYSMKARLSDNDEGRIARNEINFDRQDYESFKQIADKILAAIDAAVAGPSA